MKSIGRILQAARKQKKFTIQDVHKFIRVHPKYLKALEQDDYSVFSGEVHAKGFLKNYAEFLGLNVSEVLALWRREWGTVFSGENKSSSNVSAKPISPAKVVITPGLIFGSVITCLILAFFGYLFYQYNSFTGSPSLEVYYPENNMVLHADILDITGKTDLDSEIYINNQKVILGNNGNFATSLKLKEGINTLIIKSVNKLDKETEAVRTIIYRPVTDNLEIKESSESTKSLEM
jgi:transcriptional regulator with XRE-family HTH domain